MNVLPGIIFILIFFIWYLISKQKKRDDAKQRIASRNKILNEIKEELYHYAIEKNKIGKKIHTDIEGERGEYPWVYDDDDKIKVHELVDKYEKNIFNDPYAFQITYQKRTSYSSFSNNVFVPNEVKYIIPFLKMKVDEFPDGVKKYYSLERKF